MNIIIWIITAIITLSSPVNEITSNAFNSLETAWSISYKAAQIVLEERVAKQHDETVDDESDDKSIMASDDVEDSTGYTDADVIYWNSFATIYGFQSYNGYGTKAEFIEYAQRMVYNAETYGDPYYEDTVYEEPYEEPYVESSIQPSGEPTDNIYEGATTENSYNFSDGHREGVWHQTEDGAWIYH